MVVTHFFLLRVFVSRMISFLAFFLTLPPGSCFSMTSPCLSFKVRSDKVPSAPACCDAFHLFKESDEGHAAMYQTVRARSPG